MEEEITRKKFSKNCIFFKISDVQIEKMIVVTIVWLIKYPSNVI